MYSDKGTLKDTGFPLLTHWGVCPALDHPHLSELHRACNLITGAVTLNDMNLTSTGPLIIPCMNLGSRWTEREKSQPAAGSHPVHPRPLSRPSPPPPPRRQPRSHRERDLRKDGGDRKDRSLVRLLSPDFSSSPLWGSRRYPLRLIVNSPFYWQTPLCRAGLCCFLLLETENITWSPTVLFSQPSSLGGLSEGKVRKGKDSLTGAKSQKAPFSWKPIKQEARDLLGRVRSQEPEVRDLVSSSQGVWTLLTFPMCGFASCFPPEGSRS